MASDRLHEEGRRVVCLGYIAMFLWHLFMVAARIVILVMFARAYGPYVAIVVGVHWIATLVWLLFERTNFCGDPTSRPPKRRIYFEVPFACVVSFIFLFVYFNVKDSASLVRSVIYHLLTSVETVVLASLFYAFFATLSYAPWLFGFSVGLYLVGVALVSVYYCAWHPNRTDNCYLIGVPKHCSCRGCCRRGDDNEDVIGNVDLPLRDSNTNSSGSEGGGGEERPSIRIHETVAADRQGGNTQMPNGQSNLLLPPAAVTSNYNRLDPAGGRSRYDGLYPATTSSPLSSGTIATSSVSQAGIPQQRRSSTPGGGGPQEFIVPQSTAADLGLPYYYSSTNVRRSQSHNQPRPRRTTWFRDERRNSDFPLTSTPYSHSGFHYPSVLGGGEMSSSDFAITRQQWMYPKIFPAYQYQDQPPHAFTGSNRPLPGSSWSGIESSATGATVGSGQRLHSSHFNSCGSRTSTPYPSVQVNVIQDSMTEEIDHAAPQRISGNFSKFSPHTSQYNSGYRNSGYRYSSSSHNLRASTSNLPPSRPESVQSRASNGHTHQNGDPSYYLRPHNEGSRRYESGWNARRSSPHSRSGSCTPKQSPYLPRRGNRHFSNPLFPNDPLLQYTQLYTTHSSPHSIRRSQSGAGPHHQVSSAGGNSARHSAGNYSEHSGISQGREIHTENRPCGSGSGSGSGDCDGVSLPLSGISEPTLDACDSHVTIGMVASSNSPHFTSFSVHSDRGTLV